MGSAPNYLRSRLGPVKPGRRHKKSQTKNGLTPRRSPSRPRRSRLREGRAAGGFDGGIEKALRAILVSPDFLYRVEIDPVAAANGASPAATPNGVHRLSDLELASRLSFFLWSSVPDDELIQTANQGKL